MGFPICPPIRRMHRDAVHSRTTAARRHEPGPGLRALADAKIIAEMGPAPEEVTEVGGAGELDPRETWRFFAAERWKVERSAEAEGRRASGRG